MELKIGDEYYYCNVKPKYTNGVKSYEIYYHKVTIENIIEGNFREVWYKDEMSYQSSDYEDYFIERFGKDKREAREKAIKQESKLFKAHVDRLTTLIFGEDKDES